MYVSLGKRMLLSVAAIADAVGSLSLEVERHEMSITIPVVVIIIIVILSAVITGSNITPTQLLLLTCYCCGTG